MAPSSRIIYFCPVLPSHWRRTIKTNPILLQFLVSSVTRSPSQDFEVHCYAFDFEVHCYAFKSQPARQLPCNSVISSKKRCCSTWTKSFRKLVDLSNPCQVLSVLLCTSYNFSESSSQREKKLTGHKTALEHKYTLCVGCGQWMW